MEELLTTLKEKFQDKKDLLKLVAKLIIVFLLGVFVGNSVIFIGKDKHIVLETKTKDKVIIEHRAFYLRVNPFQNYELIDANGSMKTLLTLNDNLTSCKVSLKDAQIETDMLNKSLIEYQQKCFNQLTILAKNTEGCRVKQ